MDARPTKETDAPSTVKNLPERIYLCFGMDDTGEELDFRAAMLAAPDNIHWCEDRIDATDPEYVRADIAAEEKVKLERERDEAIQRDTAHREMARLQLENITRERDEAREAFARANTEVMLLAMLVINHKAVNVHPFPTALEVRLYKKAEESIAEFGPKGQTAREGGV